MKTHFLYKFVVTAVVVLSLNAQLSSANTDDYRARSKQVLSMFVYKDMDNLQNKLMNGQFQEALEISNRILDKGKKLKPYDRAKTFEMLTSIYLGMENYPKSAESAEAAIAEAALGFDSEAAVIHRLFYIYFFMSDYTKSIKYMVKWFSMVENPDTQSLFTAAQIYALTDDMDTALVFAKKGMLSLKYYPDKKLKESWMQLLISIQLNLKEYGEASRSLEQALSLWPHKVDYYKQLSAVYQELGKEKESFYIFSLAEQNNLIHNEGDYLRLVQMYRYHEYPAKGAVVLQDAMRLEVIEKNEKNWQTLSDALIQARSWERATEALMQTAALSDSGKNWFYLCQISFQKEDWSSSQKYCRNALDKDGADGSSWYLLGLSQYYQKDEQKALESFNRCAIEDTARKECRVWIDHIQQAMTTNENEVSSPI